MASFEQWITEVKTLYAASGVIMPDMSYQTWGEYYEDGWTPEHAFQVCRRI